MIVINDVSFNSATTTSLLVPHRVSSADSSLLVIVANNSSSLPSAILYNGAPMPFVASTNLGQATDAVEAYLLHNPPVGAGVVEMDEGSSINVALLAITMTGLDKTIPLPLFTAITLAGSSTTSTVNMQIPFNNGIIIDMMAQNQASTVVGAVVGQTPIAKVSQSVETVLASYRQVGNGLQSMSYTSSFAPFGDWLLLALKAQDSVSIAHPNIWERKFDNVLLPNGVPAGLPASYSLGYKRTPFFHNSFLHTVGRYLSPPQAAVTVTGGTTLQLLGVG